MSAIAQKFRATLKTNVASFEPGLSQYVVKSTFLYLNPTSGPRRMSNLLPSALVRSATTPTLNQLAGAQLTSPRPRPSSFLIHPSSFILYPHFFLQPSPAFCYFPRFMGP